ncbi:MAG: metallophosphoesterase [Planctomycetaceae bacterium]|jgi:Icc-related predicted phosphoesterase|nr:metallophosphoesterase [Planctomycetaceae bacterium]
MKKLLTITFFTVLLIPAMLTGMSAGQALTGQASELPRFAVISDTHFENNRGEGAKVKVPKALKNLMNKKPLVDTIFIVGDLTDHGNQKEYDQLLAVLDDKNLIPENVDVYVMMGFNHDKSSRSATDDVKNILGYAATAAQKNFLEKVKKPLHQFVEIKGYSFITLSEGGSNPSPYNNEVKKFLEAKLAEAAKNDPDKPIFVFTHVPPLNTCYGSWKNEGWGTDVFTPVLNRYPQAIVISGHSHFPIGDPRSIYQDKFTSINDGSTTYSEVEPGILNIGIHPENSEKVTEGLIVNVLENGNVEVERWDTYRNEEILPRWTINAPHNGSNFRYTKVRNGLPAPTFAEGILPTVDNITEKSCTVTFSQATDNDVVHRYLIEILDDNEKVISSFRKFSQFYLNSEMPKELSVTFTDLPSGKTLSVRVTAIDSYNNSSKPIKSQPFLTNKN